MTNLEKLANVGLVDPKRVSKQHQDIINNQLSNEEVAALISTKQKLGVQASMHVEGPSTAVF